MMAKTVLKLTRGIVGGIPLAAASSHQAETIRVTPNIRTWGGDVIIDHLGGMLGVAKGERFQTQPQKHNSRPRSSRPSQTLDLVGGDALSLWKWKR